MYLLVHSFTSPELSSKTLNGVFSKSEDCWEIIKAVFSVYKELGRFPNRTIGNLDITNNKDQTVATIFLTEGESFLEFEMTKIHLETQMGMILYSHEKLSKVV